MDLQVRDPQDEAAGCNPNTVCTANATFIVSRVFHLSFSDAVQMNSVQMIRITESLSLSGWLELHKR